MLKVITIDEASSDISTVSRNIRLNKLVLNQCRRLVNYTRCHKPWDPAMLLIVLFQKVISSHEKVITILVQQYNESHCPTDHRVQAHRSNNEEKGDFDTDGKEGVNV